MSRLNQVKNGILVLLLGLNKVKSHNIKGTWDVFAQVKDYFAG